MKSDIKAFVHDYQVC